MFLSNVSSLIAVTVIVKIAFLFYFIYINVLKYETMFEILSHVGNVYSDNCLCSYLCVYKLYIGIWLVIFIYDKFLYIKAIIILIFI